MLSGEKKHFFEPDGVTILTAVGAVVAIYILVHDVWLTTIYSVGLCLAVFIALNVFNFGLEILSFVIRKLLLIVIRVLRYIFLIITLQDRIEWTEREIEFMHGYLFETDPKWMEKGIEWSNQQRKFREEEKKRNEESRKKYREEIKKAEEKEIGLS